MTPLRYPDGHVGHLVTGLQTARSVLTDSRFGSLPAGKRSPVKVPGSELIGRIPQALQEIQEAKADRLRGDALEGGLIMLLLCTSLQRTRTGHNHRAPAPGGPAAVVAPWRATPPAR
ncbi:hypothetical protein ACLQ18_41630 [Streptomyces sp. DT193]|uniref:hypothetical protein n=1 Tax=Streptomyces sp. DT193 TaxID=3393418 RepID=UPI003CE8B1CA